MDEENDIYQQEVITDEDDALLPDGYAEGDDFFDPNSWTGENGEDSASEPAADETEDGPRDDTGTEGAPATGQPEETAAADTGTEPDNVPATDESAGVPSTKRRVRYQFDHEDREEEIDDADLPELLQKARSVDRYKARLDSAQSMQDRLTSIAKALKYDNGEAFLNAIIDNAKSSEMDSLRGRGVPDEIAEDYIARKYVGTAPPPQAQQNFAPAQPTGGRDYVSEARELLAAHPELAGKNLPQEVYAAASQPGTTLLQAYSEYERKGERAEAEKARTEAERLRKENRILKNNADSADRAPVSGVSKGGRAEDKDANDPFLKGFNSI